MAIIPLPLRFGLGYEEIYEIVEAAGGDDKACNEVAECWDMVQIWRNWFAENLGEITAIRHRSQNDDPPDLEFVLVGRTLGMEHTRLLPEHVGKAKAWMRKLGSGGFIPSVAKKTTDPAELMDIITGVKDSWYYQDEEWLAIAGLLASEIREKMMGMPAGGIIGVVVHHTLPDDQDQPRIAKVAHDIINHVKFTDFAGYTLILLARTPRFHSSLIRRGEDIREQSG
jgi:hypothetical protein